MPQNNEKYNKQWLQKFIETQDMETATEISKFPSLHGLVSPKLILLIAEQVYDYCDGRRGWNYYKNYRATIQQWARNEIKGKLEEQERADKARRAQGLFTAEELIV